jgi:hypothetical protein
MLYDVLNSMVHSTGPKGKKTSPRYPLWQPITVLKSTVQVPFCLRGRDFKLA